MATSLAQVIGANARELRLRHGVTLDQLALAARFCGLPWTTGRLGDFEAGRVAPRLDTAYSIALALRQATGEPVSLADLLAGTDPVQINDKLTVPASAVHAAMSGAPVTGETQNLRKLGALTGKAMARWVLDNFREADVAVCKTLRVTPERGAEAMAKLWGGTFTDERDRRAEPDAKAQRRGQISRKLKTELQKELADGND